MVTTLDKNTALIIIDLQNSTRGIALLKPMEEIISNVEKLIVEFRKKNLPIVPVTVNLLKSKITRTEESLTGAYELSKEQVALIPEIKTEPTDIQITKDTWDAFYETGLDKELKKKGITSIVLAGIVTSIGVEGTARSAANYGYNITFAKDAMSDRSTESHEHSLTKIFPKLGEIDTTDNIIKMLKSK